METVDVGVGTSSCDDNVCAICLECFNSGSGFSCTAQKNIATTQCGHTFCLSCLLTNLRTSNLCPLCRTPIEKDVKQVLKPLTYSEGIQLLNHELNGLRIYEDVEQYVQTALEISNQPNMNGQNVQDVTDGLMGMVTNFGFNLLFDATLHTNGGEEQHMDQEWIIQMYNNGSESDSSDDSGSSDSTINDYNNDSDSDESSMVDDSEGENNEQDDGSDLNGVPSTRAIVLPEVPESML